MLGVCVMVKSVSEMSDRKVSKSKCCRPPSSSSSFPSSMGTTLQKSWLHHFSVGLQASSSWVRWRKGAGGHLLQAGPMPASLAAAPAVPRQLQPPSSQGLQPGTLVLLEGESTSQLPPIQWPPQTSGTGGFQLCFSRAAWRRAPHHAPLPTAHPSPEDSPALGWRALPPGWTFGAGRRRR